MCNDFLHGYAMTNYTEELHFIILLWSSLSICAAFEAVFCYQMWIGSSLIFFECYKF
jgi:hypothetical protein